MIAYMDNGMCMKCKRLLAKDEEGCNCSENYSIIFGNYKLDGDNFTCTCGNSKFKTTFHMNCTHKHIYNYTCSECGKIVGIERYSPNPYI